MQLYSVFSRNSKLLANCKWHIRFSDTVNCEVLFQVVEAEVVLCCASVRFTCCPDKTLEASVIDEMLSNDITRGRCLHLDGCQGMLPVPVALPPHVCGAAPPVVPAHCHLLQLQLDLEVVQLYLGSQLSELHFMLHYDGEL